jgi:hypothetical protein
MPIPEGWAGPVLWVILAGGRPSIEAPEQSSTTPDPVILMAAFEFVSGTENEPSHKVVSWSITMPSLGSTQS